jgi:hypothetical protein
MNKLNQIQEIVRLCYEINETTGFCAGFNFFEQADKAWALVAKNNDIYNSLIFSGRSSSFEIQIENLRKFIMPEVVEMGRLFCKKDGVTIDKTFLREDLLRIVKWAGNMGVELTEKNLTFKKYNRVVINGVEHISGEIEL